LPIFVFDERFTSKISSDLISESYNTPGKRRNKSQNKKMPKEGKSQARKSGALDTVSAALILGDYLNFLKIQESKQKP